MTKYREGFVRDAERNGSGCATAWYQVNPSGVWFNDIEPGIRCRVSVNHEGGSVGYSACVFDGSERAFLEAPSLGKFDTREAAQEACLAEVRRLAIAG